MTKGYPIREPADALAFMLAGKATFTVQSDVTFEHLTFQVRNWKKAKYGTMHFVSVRTGNDYASIGAIRDRNSFSFNRNKSDLAYDDKRVRGFRYIFEHLQNRRMPPKCEIWHEGQCGRCNRPLTDPESIARGIGPECLKKMECV